MRLTHALEAGRPAVIAHRSSHYLALLDVDSYSPYLGPDADHLDLEEHLVHQRQALVGISWIVPGGPLEVSVILARDDAPIDNLVEAGEHVALDGWLRTHSGRLSLTSAERLHAAARDRQLASTQRVPGTSRDRTLIVPPGVYGVHLVREPRSHYAPVEDGTAHQTVLLRHYPPPAPRLVPDRLGSLIPWAA